MTTAKIMAKLHSEELTKAVLEIKKLEAENKELKQELASANQTIADYKLQDEGRCPCDKYRNQIRGLQKQLADTNERNKNDKRLIHKLTALQLDSIPKAKVQDFAERIEKVKEQWAKSIHPENANISIVLNELIIAYKRELLSAGEKKE